MGDLDVDGRKVARAVGECDGCNEGPAEVGETVVGELDVGDALDVGIKEVGEDDVG